MISFFTQDIEFKLFEKRRIKNWLKSLIGNENKRVGNIAIVFCSDNFLLQMNRQYLQHDFFTDVITFDYTENDIISGDIFISIDTVRINAQENEQSFGRELLRVMAHGVLHLCSYDDHTVVQQKTMRTKEEFYLGLFS